MFVHSPGEMPAGLVARMKPAAESLRGAALDERVKAHVERDPVLRPILERVARRYIGGRTISEVLEVLAAINASGHSASVDYMGESCRDAGRAVAETGRFLALVEAVAARHLNCSISLDLSHLGALIDPELGYENAGRVAAAAAGAGQEMMISMEGSDRADLILDVHDRLSQRFQNVGITIQARLHRTVRDLPSLLDRPGRIRLVKGAFAEPETIAYPRDSQQSVDAFCRVGRQLLASGHSCSIATHDRSIHHEFDEFIRGSDLPGGSFEFETLLGLGREQLEWLRQRGYATREYVVFGSEWYLYVCNRVAEDPTRLFEAVVDAVGSENLEVDR